MGSVLQVCTHSSGHADLNDIEFFLTCEVDRRRFNKILSWKNSLKWNDGEDLWPGVLARDSSSYFMAMTLGTSMLRNSVSPLGG